MVAGENVVYKNDSNNNDEELILRVFNKLFKEIFDTDYPLRSFAKIVVERSSFNSKLLLYKIINPFSSFSSGNFEIKIYSSNYFNEVLTYNFLTLLTKKTGKDYVLTILTDFGKVKIIFTYNDKIDAINIDIKNSKNIDILSDIFLSLYFHYNNFKIVSDKENITKWVYFVSESSNLNSSMLLIHYVNLNKCDVIKITDAKNPNNPSIGSLKFIFTSENGKTNMFSINYYSSKMKSLMINYISHILILLENICNNYEMYKKENKYFEKKLQENYY